MCSNHHKLLVFAGPSGSGKTTLQQMMMAEFPDKFGFSVSHTTRKPRPGEVNGKHYHFTSKTAMEQAIKEGKFIETAVYGSNMYGTSKEAVDTVIKQDKICVLDIDVQGVQQIKQTNFKPWYVFIKPPSLGELESRLRFRSTESDESLRHRLSVAEEEMTYGETPGVFDLIIVNDTLDNAYAKLKDFLLKNVLITANGSSGESAPDK